MKLTDMKMRLAGIILDKTFRYSDDPPFTLVSGRKSNYYFNCKPTMLDPEGMNLIGNIIFDMIKDSDITAVGGLTLGADPMANATSLISYQKGKPVKAFIVRRGMELKMPWREM
jgi:orotate phosphoribosyltransferase